MSTDPEREDPRAAGTDAPWSVGAVGPGAAAAHRYQVTHRTAYRYRRTVAASYSEARLLPRWTPWQRNRRATLLVEPAPTDRLDRLDHFENPTVHLAVDRPHDELTVTARTEVVVAASGVYATVDPDRRWESACVAVDAATARARDEATMLAAELVLPSPLAGRSAAVTDYASRSFPAGRPLLEALLDLVGRIHRDVAYVPGSTTVVTAPEDALLAGRGVCQDQAHLLVACLRAAGIAARYVSGYLETDPPPGQPRLTGVDASHAWASAFVPGNGWLDLDATNDLVPGTRHVTLAWGRDYGDVTPLKGVVLAGDGSHDLDVAVDVRRLDDAAG